MAIIKCKMCGGDIELDADKTYGMCEFCGSTMTLPKIDDAQRAAAFNRGNHFRRIGEFDKALTVYERIVREDDTDAEAHWCCALCRFGIEYVEDPVSFEWLPTCHRASFDSFLEDVDYLAAVEHSEGITKRQYRKDAAKIAEVQRGILATSQNAEPFDVFICYKESGENGERTRDSLIAQEIYYQLTEQGRKVFFARITLEDVVGTQYEPYIFAALNSAKVMIVVGTKPEYLNAVWVKNEWSRFLAMMKKDRHKLLLPCYRDMDPYDMPEQLSVLQSYDMEKIGFIQDLTRGIAKVLDVEKKADISRDNIVVQQVANSNTLALLKRGSMALEDGEWDKADSFYEEVLNHDPECADAYLGKLLSELRIRKAEDLVTSEHAFKDKLNYQRALRFSAPGEADRLNRYLKQNVEFLMDSGYCCLKEQAWSKADHYFTEVLRQDDRCNARLGKMLGEHRVSSLDEFIEQQVADMQDSEEFQQIDIPVEYGIPIDDLVVPVFLSKEDIQKRMPSCIQIQSSVAYWTEQAANIKAFVENDAQLTDVRNNMDGAQKQIFDGALSGLCQRVDALLAAAIKQDEENMQEDSLKKKAKEEILADIITRRERALVECEERYQLLCQKQESLMDVWSLRSLESSFWRMIGYKDCAARARQVHEKIDEVNRQSREAQERNRAVAKWISTGRCQHCGGQLQGVFTKKCAKCGKPKDY